MKSPFTCLFLLLALSVAGSMQEEAAEESDDIFRILRMRKRDVRPYRSQSYFGSGDDDIESKDLDLEEPLNYDR